MKKAIQLVLVILLLAGTAIAAEAPKPETKAEPAKPSAADIEKTLAQLKAAKESAVTRYMRADWLINLEKAKDEAVQEIRAIEAKEQETKAQSEPKPK